MSLLAYYYSLKREYQVNKRIANKIKQTHPCPKNKKDKSNNYKEIWKYDGMIKAL